MDVKKKKMVTRIRLPLVNGLLTWEELINTDSSFNVSCFILNLTVRDSV